ncbi:MAG: 4-phosphoerythronate dehydrogenase PdxB [Prevotella sp.]|nr:4-phosphoerythronate dehydrogenase PdxB [Prevotella sp.]
MKIVIDAKIPYIRDAISNITDNAVYLNGMDIRPEDVHDANALIVRTRTHCNEALLGGSKVRFVATATIGYDHIDTDYMQRAGIEWMNCPGCNSSSVAQYIRSVLILLKREKKATLKGMTIGIVGCGNVGTKVASVASDFGMKVLVCDPPRKDRGDVGRFVEMTDIAIESDIITFHVPLTKHGKYATFHLADSEFFSHLQRHPIIINTSRGGVVDNDALLKAIISDKVHDVVIDTWENEPTINLDLLEKVWLGTPHIAGYSADGKVNADNMVLEGLCRHFGIENCPHVEPPSLPDSFVPSDKAETLCLQLYNPHDDSMKLKNSPEKFEQLRNNYPLRRETYSRALPYDL